MPRILFILCVLLVPCQLTANCIGVITAGGGDKFWGRMEQGAHLAAKQLGISIYVRGANDELHISGQKLLIRRVIEHGCKALVLAPNSTERASDVAWLKAQNIPTVYVDRDMGGEVVSVIKTDNYRAGQLAGEKMVQALGGRGKVALLRLDHRVRSTSERERGFVDSMTSAGINIVVDVYLDTKVGNARFNVLATLKKKPNIDGIFTPNESTTLATMVSLKQLGWQSPIVHIGFDLNKRIHQAIVAQDIYGVVVQQPFDMGYQGVLTAYQAMQGTLAKDAVDIDVSVFFVDYSNVSSREVLNNIAK